jgi:EAL domain-containing protein (putative c-di-GMP-specific phosphodiesterase class I)
VSPRELRRPDFAERLLERIARHGLDPSRMIAEITETAAMSQSVRTEPLMGELAAGGIRVAIDDFGAGYSSLSRLRELPVHILKVERQFLTDVPEREDASAVVTAILDLGTALGMDVVVEGIETEEQRSFLVERGCRLAQGFLLGRPAPAAELRALLEGARAPV